MEKKKTLAVIGLGYVGLPLALLAANKGWRVIGIDVDGIKVDSINRGKSPLVDTEVATQLKSKPIEATTKAAKVSEAAVVVVAVPTPVEENHRPDLVPLKTALENIRPYLRLGQVLVIESTVDPGVMDEVVLPLLRKRVGLVLDADSETGSLYVVHCPERINPGDKQWTIENIPRILGGYSQRGTKMAQKFYQSILSAPVEVMGSAKEAEAVKILENTFRDVNIAFINEMAISFSRLDIDILNVIKGAATKPFAFMPHYPGSGVGGHCISVDPYYMIERARRVGFDHKFLKLAREINNGMPEYTVELVMKSIKKLGKLAKNAKVALLGLSYKANISDLRESPALEIKALLKGKGVRLEVFDKYFAEMSTVSGVPMAINEADVVVLATAHDDLVRALTANKLKAAKVKVVVDGRNVLAGDEIAKKGIFYFGVGRKFLPK